jgi:glutathione S-transferase
MEVYWFGGSPFCWRVLLALELKGITYESKLLEASNKDHKSAAFLQLNPRGTVPVIRDAEVIVRDSMAILAYVEKKHPTPPLFGDTPETTARIWERIGDHEDGFHSTTRDVIRPIFRNKVDEFRDRLAEAAVAVDTQLVALDDVLSSSTWLAGDGPSAAEVVYYPTFQRLLRAVKKPAAAALDLPFASLRDRFVHIASWLDRLEALPGVAGTRPPHWDR